MSRFTFTLKGNKIELKLFPLFPNAFLGQNSCHVKCYKFQRFLLEEFSRLFKLYSEMGKKETATSEKLVRALERSDELECENEKLRQELSDYHFYEFDL